MNGGFDKKIMDKWFTWLSLLNHEIKRGKIKIEHVASTILPMPVGPASSGACQNFQQRSSQTRWGGEPSSPPNLATPCAHTHWSAHSLEHHNEKATARSPRGDGRQLASPHPRMIATVHIQNPPNTCNTCQLIQSSPGRVASNCDPQGSSQSTPAAAWLCRPSQRCMSGTCQTP